MDIEEITRLADISKIKLSKQETAELCGGLQQLLDSSKSVYGIEAEAFCARPCGIDALRPDEKRASFSRKDILKNAKDGTFCVHRTVE